MVATMAPTVGASFRAGRHTEIDETTVVIGAPAPGVFHLRRGPRPWPVGDYRADLYLDDELVATLPFTVAP